MASVSDGFVHLRARSAYSLLEGAIKADVLGSLAHTAGMPAVALTDRTNLPTGFCNRGHLFVRLTFLRRLSFPVRLAGHSPVDVFRV